MFDASTWPINVQDIDVYFVYAPSDDDIEWFLLPLDDQHNNISLDFGPFDS